MRGEGARSRQRPPRLRKPAALPHMVRVVLFLESSLCPFVHPVRLPCNHYYCRFVMGMCEYDPRECFARFLQEKAHCPICKRAVCDGDVEDADGLQRILDQLAILRPLEKADRASEDDGVVSSGSVKTPLPPISFAPRKEKACWVWLVTGLSPADRRVVNHVSLHSSVRIVTEYCEEGTHWGRLRFQ